jgi:hypothetical protein
MVARDEGGGNAPPPKERSPFWRQVKRQLDFLRRVTAALSGLQDAVDAMDSEHDATAYHTDPCESRLTVLDELLEQAAFLLHDGDAEQAENFLLGEPGAYRAAVETFGQILSDGLELCEDEAESEPAPDLVVGESAQAPGARPMIDHDELSGAEKAPEIKADGRPLAEDLPCPLPGRFSFAEGEAAAQA